MKYWGLTDKGLVRKRNEDAYFAAVSDDGKYGLFVVCDGMGGAQSGDVASSIACRTFAEYMNSRDYTDADFESCCFMLFSAASAANKAVYEKSIEDVNCAGMGTTLVAALVHEDRAAVVNVGDSRAYHIRGNGIVQVTIDHSLVEDMVRAGDITREEARNHPQKNLITRALGSFPDTVPDVFSVELDDGDYLLLCSDGLTNELTDKELLSAFNIIDNKENVCDALLKASYVRGAHDNVTVVLCEC